MPFSPTLCPACNRELPADLINRPELSPCPHCHAGIQVTVFPSMLRRKVRNIPEAKKKEGDAACFYHPEKPAVALCDFCGVFLSDICDLHINEKHICPPCFAKAENKAILVPQGRSRILYDGVAISLAVVPFLVFLILSPLMIFAIFTSMAAIFVALRYWKKPSSVIPRSKVRFILAIGFASLQLLGIISILVLLYFNLSSRS